MKCDLVQTLLLPDIGATETIFIYKATTIDLLWHVFADQNDRIFAALIRSFFLKSFPGTGKH